VDSTGFHLNNCINLAEKKPVFKQIQVDFRSNSFYGIFLLDFMSFILDFFPVDFSGFKGTFEENF